MLTNMQRREKENINMFAAFVICISLLFTTGIFADGERIILINPNGDGGFENGPTFESNGWSVVNGNEIDQWVVDPVFLFGNIATISPYDPLAPSIVHFYKDIFIPNDVNELYLIFLEGILSISGGAYIEVHLVPPSIPVTAGSLVPSTPVYATPNFQVMYLEPVMLPLFPLPGTIQRLVFSWVNPGNIDGTVPVTIDFIELSYTQFNYLKDQWPWSNPKPQGNNFNAIVALDENTAVGVGDNGTVGKTTDRGSTWDFIFNVNEIRDPINDIVKGVSMTGQRILQAVAGNKLLTSEDDGDSWMTSPINPSGSNMNSLAAKDSIRIAVGENGEIYLSTDGGMTWTQIFSGITQHLNTVEIAPDGQFVIIGGDNNAILKSGNGGMTFGASTQMGLPPNHRILDMNITDQNGTNLTIAHSSGIYLSTNGGSNFSMVPGANSYTDAIDYDPDNPMTAVGVGALGNICYTTDGFTTHINFSTGQTDWHRNAVFLPNGMNTLIVGDNGQMFWSTDNGSSFERTSSGTTNFLYKISYAPNQFGLNYETGYTVGGPNTVLKTTNGGEDWIDLNINFSPPYFLQSVTALDENTMVAMGMVGRGVRSTNGGKSFEPADLPFPLTMYDIENYYIDDQLIIVAVGMGTDVWISFDVGETWEPFPKSDFRSWFGLAIIASALENTRENKFLGSDTISLISVGGDGVIFKSDDGGQTWAPKPSPTTENLLDVHFVDPLVGHAVGMNGTFIRSTDGGETWTQMPVGSSIENSVGSSSDFNAVSFIGPDLGIIASNDGIIFRTLNGGVTWDTLGSPTSNNLQDIVMHDPYTATAVGFGGTIIHAEPDSIIIVGVEDRTSEGSLPVKFTLEQNYPNPFNPSTSIQYAISSRQSVSLKVYDVLGREVQTLINEELAPGVYKTEWNAESFSSGVYFYRLHTGDFIETKKMVLLR